MPKATRESTPRAHPYATRDDEAKLELPGPGLTEHNLKVFQAQLLASSRAPPSSAVNTSQGSAATPTPAPKEKKAKVTKDVKPKVKAEPKAKEDKGTPKGGYDRALLVSEVSKVNFPLGVCRADSQATNANYTALAAEVGKTATQCKDTWRKTVFPALLAGREWATDGAGWSGAMKRKLVAEVLGTAKPAWEDVARQFPERTKTQVVDVWRKVVLPRLLKGQPLA
ncbi:uncharacterized protein LOC62_07G008992 [Vanrija pseudolonga]|uniref:Myb-like domain-containing protein n=1 Tax=Vanrija pseudolonga TaxID=143232 RepID=A0AAF0YKS2_9TREE|nr:hypothetical protein LOC62_07G008992 [Vanrija pseudolonga]